MDWIKQEAADNSPPYFPLHFCQWCAEKHVICIAHSIDALNYKITSSRSVTCVSKLPGFNKNTFSMG